MKRKLYTRIWARREAPEAIVVTGMRRVGKTTLMRQVYDALESENKVFLDLENPLHQKYFETENYDTIPYALGALGIRSNRRAYIFLDEIQFMRTTPSIVKYLGDHYPYKFFLTGSSSFYLKNLFSESLAGRKIIFEMYPLDFEEFLELKGSPVKIPAIGSRTKAVYDTIIPWYREYVEYGAFPGVVAKPTLPEKKEALEDIVTSYFRQDVSLLGGFRNNAAIRDLMVLLAARTGSKIDVQKLSSELGLNRITVKEYLAFLAGTYFIHLVGPFSRGLDVEIRGAKKVYLCDSGIANYLSRPAWGHLFETAVHHQLHARGKPISYYQRKSGVELDFIEDGTHGWEVKSRATRAHRATLERLRQELSLKEGHIVSFDWSQTPVVYGFQL